ncbi:MAG: PAS domain-containing protein [Deltaproteobacteria bacterium]|nr:PAS domain-containing protein [Deltaproteobacteria bacterium]
MPDRDMTLRRVLVLDARDEPRDALQDALRQAGYELVDISNAEEFTLHLDILVAHPSTEGWPRNIERLLRDRTDCRVVGWVDTLAQASVAVNTLHVDRVVQGLPEAILAVKDLEAPSTRRPTLETRVVERTAALQQIKAQWEQTFDAVRNPLAIIDEDYHLIRVNRPYAHVLACGIIDLPGRRCFEARLKSEAAFEADDDHSPCRSCPVQAALETGTSQDETLIDRAGRHWRVSASPVHLPDHAMSFVVQYHDVTQENRRQEQLRHESKMAAVGNLAGAIAHELNSPMTSILVFSEALAHKTPQGSELNDNALEINEAARRCRRLIQGLLRFARRPRSIDTGPVSLGQVFDETRPLLEHRLDVAQVTLENRLPFDLPRVCGRVADLEHVVIDLLVNALEACSAHDTITVSASATDTWIELLIEDTGKGMAPEVLEKAFEPFFTTKTDGRGTGLGLTTCETIVTQMGGEIVLTSTPDHGARATLRLPIYRDEETPQTSTKHDE